MIRRTLLLGSICAAAAAFAAPSAMADPHVGGCTLDGHAYFSNPLGTTAQDFDYHFDGTLTGCASTGAAPASGNVTAGELLDYNGLQLEEPTSTGNGACSNSTTSGTAFVQWDGGGLTIIAYDTNGVGALVALTGSVQDSMTLKVHDPALGDPTEVEVKSTVFNGDAAGGALAFEPADPTACAGAGVPDAGIQGEIGTGNYQ